MKATVTPVPVTMLCACGIAGLLKARICQLQRLGLQRGAVLQDAGVTAGDDLVGSRRGDGWRMDQ